MKYFFYSTLIYLFFNFNLSASFGAGPLDPMPNVSRAEVPYEEGQPFYETDIQCHGGIGSIDIQIIGGTGFTYQWKNSSGTVVATTKNLVNAPAGAYTITLFKNGNNSTWNFNLTEPSDINVTLQSATQGGYNISTNGGNDGSITSTVYGGVPSYYYQWSNNATNVTGISNLIAGNYSVIVTDANGCTKTASKTITQPPTPLSVTHTKSSHNGFNISCNGGSDGSINLTVTGGVAPYNYNWQNGVFTQNRTSLPAGNYTVIVDDNIAGGQETLNVTLTQPPAINITLSSPTFSNGYNTSCYNCHDGQINTTISGGVSTSPYTISWNTGATTASISNLLKGKDTITVTDINGCIVKQSFEVTGDIEGWKIGGNLNIEEDKQFIGTKDNKDVIFKTNDTTRMTLTAEGIIELKSPLKIFQPCEPTIESAFRAVYTDETGTLKIAGCGGSDGGTSGIPSCIVQPQFDAWSRVINNTSCTNINMNDIFLGSPWRNVGIGTNIPNKKLTVNGEVQFLSTNIGSLNNSFQILSGGIPTRRGISIEPESSNGQFNFFIHGWQTNSSFNFITNNEQGGLNNLMTINANGTVYIGQNNFTANDCKLAVDGKILAQEVIVKLRPWPDFVFDSNYKLTTLADLNIFINKYKHLPDLPSANDIESSGLSIGEMIGKQMQKIEELTLYVLELQKQIDELKKVK